jgi:hypothetical protein
VPSRVRRAATTLALASALALACGDASLDERPSNPSEATTSTGDTLPPLDTGEPSSTGEASTGEPTVDDDPRLCAAPCAIVLPPRWTYEGPPTPLDAIAGVHAMPAMLRDAEGMLTIAELVGNEARLHRLDAEGRLQWNVPLPLPCDTCELTDVAPHPSGDLLLSATGVDYAGELSLIAMRYDAVRHHAVWQGGLPIVPFEGLQVRSGGIAALPGDVVAQLYIRGQVDFDVLQQTLVVAYGPDGTLLEEEILATDSPTTLRPPLLARPTPDGKMLVALFADAGAVTYGLVDRIAPPLWQTDGFAYPATALDDVVLDARGHAIELGHTFDGTHAYLVLSERAEVELRPRWAASLLLPSTTASTAAIALGPDGDVYAAVRTTQAASDTAEPLAAVTMVRWTPEGELRWQSTFLHAVAESFHPLGLAVDDDEGLVLAAVVDGRIRVERRVQGCACGS